MQMLRADIQEGKEEIERRGKMIARNRGSE